MQEIIKMLDQRQDRQVSRAHKVLNKTNQIRGKNTQQQKQPQEQQRLTQQKTNEVLELTINCLFHVMI